MGTHPIDTGRRYRTAPAVVLMALVVVVSVLTVQTVSLFSGVPRATTVAGAASRSDTVGSIRVSHHGDTREQWMDSISGSPGGNAGRGHPSLRDRPSRTVWLSMKP